jgi:hypothetical protein
VTALSLSAVGCLGRKGGIALSANHLFAPVASSESGKRGLDTDGTSATTSESEDQVEGGLLLNVIVRESSAILELLAGEDESLLIGGDALLVLDLSLDIFNGVRSLNIKGDGLASESLDEDLHTSTESEDQVKSGLLLNVIVRKGSAIFELLASEDQSLLIRGDTLLILDLGLDVLNGVRGLNVQSDGFACKGLNEDLHVSLKFKIINYNLSNSDGFYSAI